MTELLGTWADEGPSSGVMRVRSQIPSPVSAGSASFRLPSIIGSVDARRGVIVSVEEERTWPSSAVDSDIEERKTGLGLVSRVRGRENVCIPAETLCTTRGVLARDDREDGPPRPDADSCSVRGGTPRDVSRGAAFVASISGELCKDASIRS